MVRIADLRREKWRHRSNKEEEDRPTLDATSTASTRPAREPATEVDIRVAGLEAHREALVQERQAMDEWAERERRLQRALVTKKVAAAERANAARLLDARASIKALQQANRLLTGECERLRRQAGSSQRLERELAALRSEADARARQQAAALGKLEAENDRLRAELKRAQRASSDQIEVLEQRWRQAENEKELLRAELDTTRDKRARLAAALTAAGEETVGLEIDNLLLRGRLGSPVERPSER